MSETPIGYLVRGKHVRCRDCEHDHNYDAQVTVSLFRENIGSYGQDCHECRTVLVTPATGWCELFTRDACGLCIDHLQEGAR